MFQIVDLPPIRTTKAYFHTCDHFSVFLVLSPPKLMVVPMVGLLLHFINFLEVFFIFSGVEQTNICHTRRFDNDVDVVWSKVKPYCLVWCEADLFKIPYVISLSHYDYN